MKNSSLSILEKIIYPLGGFLIGTLVISTGLKIAGNIWGVVAGIFLTATSAWFLQKKFPGRADKKLIAYGMAAATILITIGGILIWIAANILMEGISG